MTLLQSDRSGGRWRYEFLSESDAHEQLHHDMLQILYWWCEATCVSSLKLAAAAPLASCVNPRANERKLPPEGNTAVVFCCSCCSFYSFFSSLVCLFSFVTFSTFSSRCYRSPVRVCCVRATLHHSRTNPPSLRSGCHRRPAAGDQREQPELTVINNMWWCSLNSSFCHHGSEHSACLQPAACSGGCSLLSIISASHCVTHKQLRYRMSLSK